ACQRPVQPDQPRRAHRLGRDPGKEPARQPRVAVVEGNAGGGDLLVHGVPRGWLRGWLALARSPRSPAMIWVPRWRDGTVAGRPQAIAARPEMIFLSGQASREGPVSRE